VFEIFKMQWYSFSLHYYVGNVNAENSIPISYKNFDLDSLYRINL